MRVGKVSVADLMQKYREVRNQLSTPVDKDVDKPKKPDKSYERYLRKLKNLEENIDTFNSPDLLYYFYDVAQRNNIRYVSSNRQRDLGAFKILLNKYPARDICLMIEFLFESEQTYLEKPTITPSIIGSAWLQTIHNDSIKWVNNEFVPKTKISREWNKEDEAISIGGWK